MNGKEEVQRSVTVVRRGWGAVRCGRGQTMIEFAFSVPVMLLLIFGLIDFSRAAYTAAVVQWAAQEGARAGIVDPASVTEAIAGRLVGLQPERAAITVTRPDAGTVSVQVTYPFEFVTPMIAQFAGNEIEMSGAASMIVQPPLVGGL